MTAGEMHMRIRRHTIEVVVFLCSILLLAAALLFFPEDAQARGRRHRNFEARLRALQSENAGTANVGKTNEAPSAQTVSTAVSSPPAAVVQPAAVSLPPGPTGVVEVSGKQKGSADTPRPVVVSRPVALTGIEVSFKLDVQHAKGLTTGEGWISPPVSLHTGPQTGTAPTVEARGQVLDAKGQPVDISPEWIPADSEMVTVSPSRGNEVMITVRQAGQSTLQVTSQKIYKRLSIMAWYQDDALQVEISEKQ
jgi:hypothetical protein